MPWVLAALAALAGVSYYEVNKKPTTVRYKITFPPEAKNLNVIGPMMSAASMVGGTVQVLGDNVYLLSLPASVDLSRVFPSFPIPPSQMVVLSETAPNVSGTRIGEEYFDDGVLHRISKTDNEQPTFMVGGARRGVRIAGHVWDGSRLW